MVVNTTVDYDNTSNELIIRFDGGMGFNVELKNNTTMVINISQGMNISLASSYGNIVSFYTDLLNLEDSTKEILKNKLIINDYEFEKRATHPLYDLIYCGYDIPKNKDVYKY